MPRAGVDHAAPQVRQRCPHDTRAHAHARTRAHARCCWARRRFPCLCCTQHTCAGNHLHTMLTAHTRRRAGAALPSLAQDSEKTLPSLAGITSFITHAALPSLAQESEKTAASPPFLPTPSPPFLPTTAPPFLPTPSPAQTGCGATAGRPPPSCRGPPTRATTRTKTRTTTRTAAAAAAPTWRPWTPLGPPQPVCVCMCVCVCARARTRARAPVGLRGHAAYIQEIRRGGARDYWLGRVPHHHHHHHHHHLARHPLVCGL